MENFQKYSNEELNNLKQKWKEESEKLDIDSLGPWIKDITLNTKHDYNTVAEAVVAATLAASDTVGKTLGITAFQHGWAGGQVLLRFQYSTNKAGIKIIDFDNMLYPQYGDRFDRTIDQNTWSSLQKEAKRLLSERGEDCHPDVKEHWQSIADGIIPFKYKLED